MEDRDSLEKGCRDKLMDRDLAPLDRDETANKDCLDLKCTERETEGKEEGVQLELAWDKAT